MPRRQDPCTWAARPPLPTSDRRSQAGRFLTAVLLAGHISVSVSLTAAALVCDASPALAAGPRSVLPFIEDDYARAQRLARDSGRLLVIDAWAPWCHTCLSMRNLVFPDPQLAPLADRFVYLAVDTELPQNAAFVDRFPIRSLPTILVLDGNEQVVARFTGAMTASELRARLEDLGRTAKASAPAGPSVDALLQKADGAAAAGNPAAATTLYDQAARAASVEKGPRSAAQAARARLGQIQTLREAGQYRACAELSDLAHHEVGRDATATDFFSFGADCTSRLSEPDVQQRLRRQLRGHLEAVVRDPQAPLLPDDRSDGYATLIDLAEALSDSVAADRYTSERLALLEGAAAQTKDPIAAATYDAHRLECYRRLKRYPPAEAMLLASQRAMPQDYNPPARLARLYLDMGRLDAGLTAIDRALSLAQGPRRVSMYELRANLLHALGRTPDAIASLDSAIRLVTPKQGAAPTVAAAAQSRIAQLRKAQDALRQALAPAASAAKASGSAAPPVKQGTHP